MLITDGCGNLGPLWGAGLQAVRTMGRQAVCRYATLVLWDVMRLGSGGVRDGLENTCYSTAVCIARGEGGCDFYSDDLLLAGFLCYLTPCVCVAYVWNGSRWFQVSLCTMRFIWIRNLNAQNPWDVWQSGYVASFPSDSTVVYPHTLVKRQESDVRSFRLKTYRIVIRVFYLCRPWRHATQ